MLRLVHPAPPNQPSEPRKRCGRHAPALSLTADEVRHVRTALKNLRRLFGSWSSLAVAMGVGERTLTSAAYERKHHPSGTLAIRLAKAGGMSVEAVLTGALSSADQCATCGHRPGTGRLVPPEGGAR